MHTSTRLRAHDFQFWKHSPKGVHLADFAAFCPGYHELDRIGVVSPTLEAGVYQTSFALLALTTAFYDSLRACSADFFDYPQHFAFVGVAGNNICTGNGLLPPDTPKLWHAWSWLDLWPENKWITAPATTAEMLQRVFDYQINRLFWPRDLQPDGTEAALPSYVWKMLQTRLKAVYYYGDPAPNQMSLVDEWIELRVAPEVEAVVQESLDLLLEALRSAQPLSLSQCYMQVSVADFLTTLQLALVES